MYAWHVRFEEGEGGIIKKLELETSKKRIKDGKEEKIDIVYRILYTDGSLVVQYLEDFSVKATAIINISPPWWLKAKELQDRLRKPHTWGPSVVEDIKANLRSLLLDAFEFL
jgi:hypothetical protein